MFHRFDRLGIFLTRQCPFTCEHCFTRSSPKTTEMLDVEVAVGAIRGATGHVATAGITGGEALIYPEKVAEIIRATRGVMPVSVITGAYWAKTRRLTERALRPLEAAGVALLWMSFDPYHERFLSRDQFRRGLDRALELGIPVAVQLVDDEQSPVVEEMARWLETRDVLVSRPGVSPTGRAIETLPSSVFRRLGPVGCNVVYQAAVSWTGDVHACCGPAVFESPDSGLHLGNVHEEPIGGILERGEQDLLLGAIGTLGPARVAAMADGHPDEMPERTVPCAVCVPLMRDAARREAARKALDNHETRRGLAAAALLVAAAQQAPRRDDEPERADDTCRRSA